MAVVLDNALAQREGCSCRPRTTANLAKDVAQVSGYRVLAEDERGSDLTIGPTCSDQAQHFCLSFSERPGEAFPIGSWRFSRGGRCRW